MRQAAGSSQRRVALDGGAPRLQVIDNGPGIAPAERDAVFRRCYRGESGQAVEGTGLGLSCARSRGCMVPPSRCPIPRAAG